MKALPKKFSTQTIKFSLDQSVEFTVEPLVNQTKSYIDAMNLEEGETIAGKTQWHFNPGGGYDIIGFALKSITGIEGLELEFEKIKIGKRNYERVTDETIDQIPNPVYNEILFAARNACALSEEDQEEINFTPNSPTEISTAPEMSEPVLVDEESSQSEAELLTG